MSEPLYILMPVHNRRAVTLRMVEALRAQQAARWQLVLVDDGSTDGTAEAVCALQPDAVVIRGDGTWWWAGCLDRGCAWLRERAVPADTVVCFLNDDVGIGPDFLARAVAELGRHPATLLLPRTGRGPDGVRADLGRLRFAPEADPAAVHCLPTRGLFLRWGDLERAGGFHPRLLPHYFSDYEFTLRARARGLRLRVADTVSLSPQPGQTGWSREDLFARRRGQRWAMLFSPRFKENPFARSAFVWLAVPWWLKPWAWLRVWGGFSLLMARCLLTPARPTAQSGN